MSSETSAGQKPALVIALAVVVLVAVIGLLIWFVRWEDTRSNEAKLKPVSERANAIVPPAGAVRALPDNRSNEPLRVVKFWNMNGSLDDSCTAWRDVVRSWLGSADLGSVSGEDTPGSSCSLHTVRDHYVYDIQVAKYGDTRPLATLTVTKETTANK